MTMSKRNIPISLPSMGEEEWMATKEVFMSGWVTQGPKVKEFENRFAEIHKVKTALAVTSCTTGLHLALTAVGVKAGDEVIVPAFTWVATANVVKFLGATPVFADVDTKTNNIKVEGLSKLRTDKTKAIIPVHLFGLCADIDGIRSELPGIKIIEDAACSAGGIYKEGRFAGALGDIGVFSLHPRKSITTGEGGMVTTNDPELAEICEKLRNHGAEVSEEQRHLGPKPYLLPDFNMVGYNYRMTDIQGAVGLVQVNKLAGFVSERQEWAKFYEDQFADVDWITTPEIPKEGQHAWQSYVLYVDPDKAPRSRNDIMMYLKEMGVAARPGTHAVHMLNYYKEEYGFKAEDFPGAFACDQNTMSIPLHNKMVKEDYEYVVQVLKDLK